MCGACMQKLFEIQEIPRVVSQQEAKEKYGENYQVIDGIIGKVNEAIRAINDHKRYHNY